MPHQLEIGFPQQSGDVGFLTGKEIIDANDIVPFIDELFTQPRTEKACSTGHQNAFDVLFHKCSQRRKPQW